MSNIPSFTSYSRSLNSGLRILSCFQPGIGGLKNSEISRLTGLHKSTVTRLTSTLVQCGFLEYEADRQKTYFLGPALLDLGLARKIESEKMRNARAMMRIFAKRNHVNVSLSIPDGLEMVYLIYLEYDHTRQNRAIQSGTRVPIAKSIVGAAYLNSLDKAHLNEYKRKLKTKYEEQWPLIKEQLSKLIDRIKEDGTNQIVYNDELIAISTRLSLTENENYWLTASVKRSYDRDLQSIFPDFLKFSRALMINN